MIVNLSETELKSLGETSAALSSTIATIRVIAIRQPEPIHSQVMGIANQLHSIQMTLDALIQMGQGRKGLYAISGGRDVLDMPGDDTPF
jgi:hypothetical protein